MEKTPQLLQDVCCWVSYVFESNGSYGEVVSPRHSVMKKTAYERWVIQFVERLKDYFNLAGWTVGVEFSDEEKGESYAEITVNSVYQTASLHVYKQTKLDFEAGHIATLTMGLVHEIVHIFLDPFQDHAHNFLSISSTPAFMNIVENTTQKLTMVFLKSLPKSLIPPRKRGHIHNSTPADHK